MIALPLAVALAASAAAAEPRIAFVERSEKDGRRELLVADAKAKPLRVVHSSKDVFDPAWSPDGRLLLYTVGLSSGAVWTAFASGGPGHPVPGATGVLNPRWSFDGAEVVFHRDGAIWSVSRDGGKPRVVCPAPEGALFLQSAPSPDGRKLAAIVTRPGSSAMDLRVMKDDCSESKALTSEGTPKTLAGWSQNGIALLSRKGVILVPQDGTKPRTCPGLFLHASWTDDGRLLTEAFVDLPDGRSATRLSLLDPRGCASTTLAEFKDSSLNGLSWRRTSRR